MRVERRGRVVRTGSAANQRLLGGAGEFVKAVCDFQASGLGGIPEGQGQPGRRRLDDESIAEFERDLKGNLYKLWNRLSSGSYMPPPVRAVEIPKRAGSGVRTLGVPTVQDRIAQTVATLYLEPGVEPHFHPVLRLPARALRA